MQASRGGYVNRRPGFISVRADTM